VHPLKDNIALGGGNDDFLAVDAFADENAGRIAAEVGNGGHSFGQREKVARAVLRDHEIGGDETAAQFGNLRRKLRGDHPRHGACAADVEVGVVPPSVGPAGTGPGFDPHVICPGRLLAQRRHPCAGQPFGVDQLRSLRRGHTAHGVGIGSVGVVEQPIGETTAHNGRQQHRDRPLFARFTHIAAQVAGIPLRSGVAGRIVLFLVVVPELDEDVVAGLQFVINGGPASFVAERFGRTPVRGVVLDPHRTVEQRLEQLPPAPLGILPGKLLRGARRVAYEVDAQRPPANIFERQHA